MELQELYSKVLEVFEREMPQPDTELHFSDPYQLVVAVILSAQCTDKRVNQVTPALFAAYPTVHDLARAEAEDVLPLISSCSYPNSKARHLVGMARRVAGEYGGRVPDAMDQLLTLPGVGRKTANVILAVAYGQPAMAVDTHVFRVAERIGLTTGSRTPRQTEEALTAHIPASKMGKAHHWLILHGRYVCRARSPQCGQCPVAHLCRHYKETQTSPHPIP